MANRNFNVKYTLAEANIVKRSLERERAALIKQRQAATTVVGRDPQVEQDLRTINDILNRDF